MPINDESGHPRLLDQLRRALPVEEVGTCSHEGKEYILAPNSSATDTGFVATYTGFVKTMWDNGQVKVLAHYSYGVLDGGWSEWHRNGNKKLNRGYKMGKSRSSSTEWYENGNKKEQTAMSDGSGCITKWYENGNLEMKLNYLYGEFTGPATQWHENGHIKLRAHYNGSEPVGVWTEWDKDGNVVRETRHTRGGN
jgi:antitoxin component YwqK of YwqJK toxin-antitoxin module